MIKVKAALLSLLLLTSSSVIAGPSVYEVSASIKQAGEVAATPIVRVKPGASAEMTVAGDNGYRLSVTVSPAESKAVDVTISVATSQASLRSVVTTLLDKPIVVSSGGIEVSITVKDGDS